MRQSTKPVRLGGVKATDESSIRNQDCSECSFFQTSAISSMIRRLAITKKGVFQTTQIEQQGMLKGSNKRRSCKWFGLNPAGHAVVGVIEVDSGLEKEMRVTYSVITDRLDMINLVFSTSIKEGRKMFIKKCIFGYRTCSFRTDT